jgi:hypothetical protein
LTSELSPIDRTELFINSIYMLRLRPLTQLRSLQNKIGSQSGRLNLKSTTTRTISINPNPTFIFIIATPNPNCISWFKATTNCSPTTTCSATATI